MTRNAEFRTPVCRWRPSAEFFLSSQFRLVLSQGAAGRRVSLARCADDPGSPVGPRLGTGRSIARWGHCGVCGCGTSPRRVMALRDGAASAPLDVTAYASVPSCGTGVTTSTHRHLRTLSARHARARVTHVTHLWPARVFVALCNVSACVCVGHATQRSAAQRSAVQRSAAQRSDAKRSANTRTCTTRTHSTATFHSTSAFHRPPPEVPGF